MELKRKIAYNTIVQIIGKGLSTLLGVLALAIIARYLGATGFGEYSTVITFVSFFAMSADLGLTLISAQMISDPREDQNKALSNLFSIRLFSAIILIGLAPLLVLLFPYGEAIKIGVAIATLSYLFPALNQILIALFQKSLKMKNAMISEVAGKFVLVLGFLIVVSSNWGLNGILWISALSAAIHFSISWFLGKKSAKITLSFDFSVWKRILLRTWPLALTVILNLLYQKGDIIILSLYQSIKEVGIYGAPYRTIEVLGTLPYMFAGIMLPLFTFAWIKQNFSFFRKMLQKSLDFMIILALPLIVGTQFTAREIISMIAGEEFADGGAALQILIISIALLFISCIFSHVIIAINQQKKVIKLYLFTTITSLALYFILIPEMSYIGAALVTIYSNILILWGSYYYVRKLTDFKIKTKIFFRALLSSLGMAIFMISIPKQLYENNIYLLLIIFLSASIYFMLLYLLKGISRDDLKIFLTKKTYEN
jgi:O-antigen/teichoic acid export membrane protein